VRRLNTREWFSAFCGRRKVGLLRTRRSNLTDYAHCSAAEEPAELGGLCPLEEIGQAGLYPLGGTAREGAYPQEEISAEGVYQRAVIAVIRRGARPF